MWFDSWNDLLRIVFVGALAYGIFVLLVRLSGKRTLAKLNAFDFVITIALGSTVATILLDSRTSLADGLVAIWLLVFLQLLVAALTARLPQLRGVFTAAPAVLLLHGQAQPDPCGETGSARETCARRSEPSAREISPLRPSCSRPTAR